MTGADFELADVPIEVRTTDEPKRQATLLVTRYGELSMRTPRPERFAPGAFSKSVAARGNRIAFTTRHTGGSGIIERGANVARPLRWDTSDPSSLIAEIRFFDDAGGWEMFNKARDGELNGASVGFKAVEERTGPDGAREIVEGILHHVMLVDRTEATPAYDQPRVLETRTDDIDLEALLAVRYPDGLADQWVSADEIRRMIHPGG